jgi:hypothetical protein
MKRNESAMWLFFAALFFLSLFMVVLMALVAE